MLSNSTAASGSHHVQFDISFNGQPRRYIDASQVQTVVVSPGVHQRAVELARTSDGSGTANAADLLVLSAHTNQQQQQQQDDGGGGAETAAAAAAADKIKQQQQQHQGSSTNSRLEFVTLIFPHVCLDLFTRVSGAADAAVEGLAALAASIVAAAAAEAAANSSGRIGVGGATCHGTASTTSSADADLLWVQQAASAGELTQQLCKSATPATAGGLNHLLQAVGHLQVHLKQHL